MTAPRENFIRRPARGGRSALGRSPRGAAGRSGAPRGDGLRAALRRVFRGGSAGFATKLSAEATVFAVVACAITLAVLSQDPGAQAAPPRAAGRATWYPPAGGANGRATPETVQGVRRPPIRRDATIGHFAARWSEAKRTSTPGPG